MDRTLSSCVDTGFVLWVGWPAITRVFAQSCAARARVGIDLAGIPTLQLFDAARLQLALYRATVQSLAVWLRDVATR